MVKTNQKKTGIFCKNIKSQFYYTFSDRSSVIFAIYKCNQAFSTQVCSQWEAIYMHSLNLCRRVQTSAKEQCQNLKWLIKSKQEEPNDKTLC